MKRDAVLYGAVGLLLALGCNVPIWIIALFLLALHRLGGYQFLYILVKTGKRDMMGLIGYGKMMWRIRGFQRNNYTIPIVFEKLTEKHPKKACVIFEDQVWTFEQMNHLSNQVAHLFEDAGFKTGDTVALLMNNRPEYVAIWLGLAKAGIVTALINYNLKGEPLRHSIEIVDSKAIIFGADFTDVVDEIREKLSPTTSLFTFDVGQNTLPSWSKNMDTALAKAPKTPLAGPQRSQCNDKLLYIYTSGTTGLPKAAIIRNFRYTFFSSALHYMNRMRPDDILYNTLPLYHSAGGITALGQNIHFGCTMVLRKKFSASAFWTDACRHQVTIAIYIGEICRYLLASPVRPEERAHKIRLMYGNGMRPQIWQEFIDRFNIPIIAELYGATESISNILNFEGVVGAVGFVSRILPNFYPVALIKVDDEGEPIRGPDGLCIRCQPGEPGMFVGLVTKGHAIRNFDGYADKKATSKKMANNIFRYGDTAFLSGDLLEMDELGYLYFLDRLGDTFRWRGENVSTTEVEAVVSNVADLKDCTVYGVEVPGSEGRAGMAAILDPDRSLDLNALAQGLAKALPPYACPVFLRIVSTIDMTGTYKLRKADYQKEGFDLTKIQDDIYIMDMKSHTYIPLTVELHQQLLAGNLRL